MSVRIKPEATHMFELLLKRNHLEFRPRQDGVYELSDGQVDKLLAAIDIELASFEISKTILGQSVDEPDHRRQRLAGLRELQAELQGAGQ